MLGLSLMWRARGNFLNYYNPGPCSNFNKLFGHVTTPNEVGRSSVVTIPSHSPVSWRDIKGLQAFVDDFRRFFVITGAGLSTESGIPDYRSPKIGRFNRPNASTPVLIQDFLRNPNARRRLWARNYAGYPVHRNYSPNASHEVLKRWEEEGRLQWLLTQNVDGLHRRAGSQRLTELHGNMYRVVCTNSACDWAMSREDCQALIASVNPGWDVTPNQILPDGDTNLSEDQIAEFHEPSCPKCESPIRPDIVFFGDFVPRGRVLHANEQLKEADAVLVFGSSLKTYSAYRFVMAAAEFHKPVAIVNIGETRADLQCDVKIEGRCGEILQRIEIC